MAKIREIFVNEEDVSEMMGGMRLLDIDAHHAYGLSDILGADETVLCWSRQMQLEEPGELKSPALCRPDHGGAMRRLLAPYVDGLERCGISLFFGNLLAEKRRDKWVLEVKPFDQAQNTIVIIRWPTATPIDRDKMKVDGLERDLGLRLMHRVDPDENNESYGEDVLVLNSDRLSSEFWLQIEEYENVRTAIMEDSWTDFEVSRGYYRAKMEELQKAAEKARLKLEFTDDFVQLKIIEGGITEGMPEELRKEGLGRCWYNDTGLSKLKAALTVLGPVVSMYDFLSQLG